MRMELENWDYSKQFDNRKNDFTLEGVVDFSQSHTFEETPIFRSLKLAKKSLFSICSNDTLKRIFTGIFLTAFLMLPQFWKHLYEQNLYGVQNHFEDFHLNYALLNN